MKNLIDGENYHSRYLDIPNNFLRYNDIRPYYYNNVPIDEGNKYINASWIHIPLPFSFIATQGPIPQTVEDFWIMCYTYDVKSIVMLCQTKEKNVEKCAKYWDAKNMNYFKVKLIEEKSIDKGIDYRVFQLINIYKKNDVKIISQIHLTCWDDHAALSIDYFDKILTLIDFVDKTSDNKPVMVHCSAGVGRTGTFISLYNLYHEIMKQIFNEKKNFIEFSVFNLVRKIKELRMYMVENQNQYAFLYHFTDYLLYMYNNLKKI